jgi:hypothetical protein
LKQPGRPCGALNVATPCQTHSILSRELLHGVKYDPLEVRSAAQILKINKYADFARNKNHEFVPLVAESLGGLGEKAVKLFG